MPKKIIFLVVTISVLSLLFLFLINTPRENYKAKIGRYLTEQGRIPRAVREERPNDWFYRQRAYPFDSIPNQLYHEARAWAVEMRLATGLDKDSNEPAWNLAGPTNIPGRVCDIAVHPSAPNTIYIASASGGVFKSTDRGVSWNAIFDDHSGQPMGAVAIDPSDPQIIYCGTGEPNPAANTYEGDGIYKSIDGGLTWANMGLPYSYRIARICVDPLYPDTLYVAVFGSRWSEPNPERGVYRSEDGGTNWDKIHYVADTVGCIDLALHGDSGVLLAAMWDRNSPIASIWRSPDRGDTWNLISGSNGLPVPDGRCGVTFGKTHNTAYVLYAYDNGAFRGLYKSSDLGQNWTPTNGTQLSELNGSWNGGWYFGNVRVSPTDPDVVFALGLNTWRTVDGGANWEQISFGNPSGLWEVQPHVDQHAMYILETDDDYIYLGNDGGVSLSEDQGDTWDNLQAMPNTQFYAINIDYQNPERLYGGAQDNGTMRTPTGALDDWENILGGDGFYCAIDYTNPDIVYAEAQYGWLTKSYDGGQTYEMVTDGIDPGDPSNWNTPVIMDPNDPQTLYLGTNRVYKTTDGADNWSPISFVISTGTITTIDVSRTDPDVIYVGCTDGVVGWTDDGGASWYGISSSLPNRWVTRVTVDPFDQAIAYVTLSGYRDGDYLPHIFRTVNSGASWTDISGNLPDVPVNDCIVDVHHDNTLYIATDVGVFKTSNLGGEWVPFGTGMPPSIVHDLVYHYPTRSLVAGTHGRSMYRITIDCEDTNDIDSDGTPDQCDNCPDDYNLAQTDFDIDFIGDICDDDDDNDGILDISDNCQFADNAGQEDFDSDGIGDACDACPEDELNDLDSDNICAGEDNCSEKYNPLQEDSDEDGIGDSCDNCIFVHNPDQLDENENDIGDVCEGCCIEYTGNADCIGPVEDPEAPDIADIVRLIDFLYLSHDPLCCLEEADVDVSGPSIPEEPESAVDISDIVYLIDHLYLTHKALPECP